MSSAPARCPANANLALLQFESLGRFGTYRRLYFEGRDYSNVEELQGAGRLARILGERGLGAGERIVTLMPNTPELTFCFQAVWTIGGVLVPLAPKSTAAELDFVLRNSGASAVITVPAVAARVAERCCAIDSLKHLLVLGESNGFGQDISRELAEGPWIDAPVVRSPDDLAMLVYTAAAGNPKGAMLTHANIAAAVHAMSSMNTEIRRLPIIHVLPLTHVFGLLMLLCANRWGMTSVLLRQFDPIKTLAAIASFRAGYLPVVPTMMVYLLSVPRGRFSTDSLCRVSSGGAALSEELRLQFEETFRCRVDQGYGMTESVGTITSYTEREPYRPGSAGRAAVGIEVIIVDEQGRYAPPRTVGEICVRGANITSGYWRDEVATREAFTSGWLRTGDTGYLDEDGYLYITGRKKELIIKGGENISPREIEDVLYLHPGISEAAVIGIPDPVFGEQICAVIQLKPGWQASEEEVRSYLSNRLTKFKVPARIVFHAALPKDSAGRLEREQIRAQFAHPAAA